MLYRPRLEARESTAPPAAAVFANEAERLLAEELGDVASGCELERVPWHEPLTPTGLAELDEAVTLVAGRSRLGYRHPLPTDAPLGDRAMLVVCGRRQGLITNATRWVRFAAADPAEADAARRILDVETAFFDATRPGATVAYVFAAGIASYARHGFRPRRVPPPPPGGAAGYAARDPRAIPGIGDVVQAGQAFAWNPTAPGAEVEDTVVVGPRGIEVLTVDPRWPTVDPRWPTVPVGGLERPIELPRPDTLAA